MTFAECRDINMGEKYDDTVAPKSTKAPSSQNGYADAKPTTKKRANRCEFHRRRAARRPLVTVTGGQMRFTKSRKFSIIISAVAVVILGVSCTLYFGHFKPKAEREERQRQNLILFQRYYDGKLAEYAEENETIGEVDVAFIGDSITDGWRLEEYFPIYKTANRGISGDTTFGVEKRLKVSLYDINPRVVVMLIGGNNLDTMLENYEDILVSLKENLPDTRVVLCSLTAMGGEWSRNNKKAVANNTEIKRLAEKHGYTFVDFFTPLYDADSGIKAGYAADGVHPNDICYRVMADILSPVLERLLDTDVDEETVE